MGEYAFSNAADRDLENLLKFGLANFGEVVAVEYFDESLAFDLKRSLKLRLFSAVYS
jgi:plasmid stabilization system protein ParE